MVFLIGRFDQLSGGGTKMAPSGYRYGPEPGRSGYCPRFILFKFSYTLVIWFFLILYSHPLAARFYDLIKPALEYTGVLADIEGNWPKFLHYVETGDTLDFGEGNQIQVKPGRHFVFLGDAIGRGAGSMRIVNALVNLKERFPQQVTLILGNHDIGQLQHALSADAMKTIPLAMHGWLRQRISGGRSPVPDYMFQRKLPELNTRENRLRFLLEMKKGEPQAFEYRRQELRLLTGEPWVSGDQVVDSFLHELKP